MPTISTTLPSDGSTIDAADVNTPFNDILNVVNGNLDADNIADDAITADQIADGAVTQDKLNAASLTGWLNLGATPNTITNNGNRSYDLVFNSNDLTDTLSEGMKLKLTRTTTAPTQSTSLNGTTQYWSKSSPAGTTFTDDFCAGAWVYLTSYQASGGIILSRYNGTSGWQMSVNSSGQVSMAGYNGGSGNSSTVTSSQSIPLNKWVHISTQLDMSAFTATTTTSYVMIDGVDVPATVSRGGTNPTALVQAGNLEVGSWNGGLLPFGGKLAQAWYSSAKITQANIRTFMSQGITTSDISAHSIVSAYSFDGNATDVNLTSANNLTATASAGYTSDSPFANGSRSYDTAGTTEYAIVATKPAFSTNTTVTVQVPEGCAIPTSGGVNTVSYSTQSKPYGFPTDRSRYELANYNKVGVNAGASSATWYSGTSTTSGSFKLVVPKGSWTLDYYTHVYSDSGSAAIIEHWASLSTIVDSESEPMFTTNGKIGTQSSNSYYTMLAAKSAPVTLASMTPYYLIAKSTGALSNHAIAFATSTLWIRATPNFL